MLDIDTEMPLAEIRFREKLFTNQAYDLVAKVSIVEGCKAMDLVAKVSIEFFEGCKAMDLHSSR